MRNHLFRSKGFYGFRASYHGPRKCYECKNTNQVSVSVSVSNTAREGLHQQALSKLGKNHQFLGDRLEQNMQHALQQLSYRVVFFSLRVPPNFSTKKKIANQPIRAGVLVNPLSKKGRDWLLGGFSFWY